MDRRIATEESTGLLMGAVGALPFRGHFMGGGSLRPQGAGRSVPVDLEIVGGALVPTVGDQIREVFGGIDPPEFYEIAGRVLARDVETGAIVGHAAWLFRTMLVVAREPESVVAVTIAGIADVYTLPTYRRRGIGLTLMQAALGHLGESTPVLLFSVPDAVPFYLRCGLSLCPLKAFYPSPEGVREKPLAMVRHLVLPERGLIYVNGAVF